jgi:amino acid transporter
LVVILPSNFEALLSYFGFSAYLWYGLTVVVLIVLRQREPDIVRPFTVRPYPFVPLLFVGLSVVLVIATLLRSPLESLLGLFFICTGLPIYFIFIHNGNKLVFLTTVCLQRLFLLKRQRDIHPQPLKEHDTNCVASEHDLIST